MRPLPQQWSGRRDRPTWGNVTKHPTSAGSASTALHRPPIPPNTELARRTMRWTALRRSVRARRAAEQAVTTRSSAPPSVEAALRKVRLVATVIVAIRLFSLDETRELLSWPWLIAIAGSFAAVNLVSLIGQRSGRITPVLDAVQLLADTTLVLIVLWIGQDDPEPRRLGDHGPPGARRRDPVPSSSARSRAGRRSPSGTSVGARSTPGRHRSPI